MATLKIIKNIRFYISVAWLKFTRSLYLLSVKGELGECGKNVILEPPAVSFPFRKVCLHDNTNIYGGAKLIISNRSDNGKMIFKNNSGSAEGLTIVTGNHQRVCGKFFKESGENDIDEDVVVEEDVWIGINVTILSGVTIGRGATVGAGSVCIKSVPPYAVVMGNPAKVVGFNFTPEEIIEHEKALYSEEERLPLELLEKNYKKYFLDHIKEIKAYTGLICK